MNCYYCDKIKACAPSYSATDAAYDLGSAAPRCSRHWRFACGQCGCEKHFMSFAWCPKAKNFYCVSCATERVDSPLPFWAWLSYTSLRSPWSGEMHPSLDRAEFEGRHPFDDPAASADARALVARAIPYIPRYPARSGTWRVEEKFSLEQTRENWNANAEIWDKTYDDDGDRNRRYQSDEPMLALLGDVAGKTVLDAGSGAGYLCRKLSKLGAKMIGVELSDGFMQIAKARESEAPLGIAYQHASITEMKFLADHSIDKAVSNYVLMDVTDYAAAVREVYRVLKPGGQFVVVISHPAFACGGWTMAAPDSPRMDDRAGWAVDHYFKRSAYMGAWGNLKPVLSFHRPLRDYWQAFTSAGFTVDGFEEPSVTERGRRELDALRVQMCERIPFSCIFRLKKG